MLIRPSSALVAAAAGHRRRCARWPDGGWTLRQSATSSMRWPTSPALHQGHRGAAVARRSSTNRDGGLVGARPHRRPPSAVGPAARPQPGGRAHDGDRVTGDVAGAASAVQDRVAAGVCCRHRHIPAPPARGGPGPGRTASRSCSPTRPALANGCLRRRAGARTGIIHSHAVISVLRNHGTIPLLSRRSRKLDKLSWLPRAHGIPTFRFVPPDMWGCQRTGTPVRCSVSDSVWAAVQRS